jgi:hypothetical protein
MPSVYDPMYVTANAMSMIFNIMWHLFYAMVVLSAVVHGRRWSSGSSTRARGRVARLGDNTCWEKSKNEKASLEGMSEAFGLFAGANDH